MRVRGRRVTACLAFVACLGPAGVSLPAVAAAAVLPPDAGAPPGVSTSVPLSLEDAGGLLGGDFVIQYDPAVAQVEGLSTAPLSSGCVLTFNVDPPGTIRVALYGTLPVEGSGTLLIIEFTSLGPLNSETPLLITTADINEEPVPVSSGHYCVQDQVGEVQQLSLALSGGVAELGWQATPAAVGYNVYRATRADLGDLALFSTVSGTAAASDADMPAPLLVYLVTGVNCRGEGSPGLDSRGSPRTIPGP